MRLDKPNRDKKREPKGGKDWCHKCDASQVGDGEKCKNCGNMNGIRKNKKPYPITEVVEDDE